MIVATQNVEVPTEEIVQMSEDCSTDDHVLSAPAQQKNKKMITSQNSLKEKARFSGQKRALKLIRQLNALKKGLIQLKILVKLPTKIIKLPKRCSI